MKLPKYRACHGFTFQELHQSKLILLSFLLIGLTSNAHPSQVQAQVQAQVQVQDQAKTHVQGRVQTQAQAQVQTHTEVVPKTFQVEIEKKPIEIIRDDEQHLTINKSCRIPSKNTYNCQAYRALKTATYKPISTQRREGQNPGTLICSLYSATHIAIGYDEERNENSYCIFPDGSMIDSGTLFYHALENDDQRQRQSK